MNLSKLVYLCVKNAVYYDDTSFTYEAFLQGKYNEDPDYSTNIHNVFQPLNMAIARLNDTDRLPFVIKPLEQEVVTTFANESEVRNYLNENGAKIKSEDNVAAFYFINGVQFNIKDFTVTKKYIKTFEGDYSDFKELMGVAAINNRGSVRPLSFVFMYGKDIIRIVSEVYPDEKVYVEYKRDIPFLSNSEDFSGEGCYYNYDFIPNALTGALEVDETTKVDVDLKQFGINESMCNYIMEYVRAQLLEPIDVHLSNMHLTRAEQYFRDLPIQQGSFLQRSVETVWGIND